MLRIRGLVPPPYLIYAPIRRCLQYSTATLMIFHTTTHHRYCNQSSCRSGGEAQPSMDQKKNLGWRNWGVTVNYIVDRTARERKRPAPWNLARFQIPDVSILNDILLASAWVHHIHDESVSWSVYPLTFTDGRGYENITLVLPGRSTDARNGNVVDLSSRGPMIVRVDEIRYFYNHKTAIIVNSSIKTSTDKRLQSQWRCTLFVTAVPRKTSSACLKCVAGQGPQHQSAPWHKEGHTPQSGASTLAISDDRKAGSPCGPIRVPDSHPSNSRQLHASPKGQCLGTLCWIVAPSSREWLMSVPSVHIF
ncbi:hypothetical protein V8F33_007146 [Rhypophila sp. PSN 637]